HRPRRAFPARRSSDLATDEHVALGGRALDTVLDPRDPPHRVDVDSVEGQSDAVARAGLVLHVTVREGVVTDHAAGRPDVEQMGPDRKSTRLNSSHVKI